VVGKTLFGAMVMGWGLFNLVEGIIDHHILGIHHVVESMGLSIYDYVFLAPESSSSDRMEHGSRRVT
jgi:uncharacterized membrane protein